MKPAACTLSNPTVPPALGREAGTGWLLTMELLGGKRTPPIILSLKLHNFGYQSYRNQGYRRGLRPYLEAPEIVHLPAEVEVEFSDQQPIPVTGQPRSPAAIRGCYIAGAIKIAKVFVGCKEQRKTDVSCNIYSVGCAEGQAHRHTQDKTSTASSLPSTCQMLRLNWSVFFLRPEGPASGCKGHPCNTPLR